MRFLFIVHNVSGFMFDVITVFRAFKSIKTQCNVKMLKVTTTRGLSIKSLSATLRLNPHL